MVKTMRKTNTADIAEEMSLLIGLAGYVSRMIPNLRIARVSVHCKW